MRLGGTNLKVARPSVPCTNVYESPKAYTYFVWSQLNVCFDAPAVGAALAGRMEARLAKVAYAIARMTEGAMTRINGLGVSSRVRCTS